ncbi:NfeD family protein [Sphingomonas qomolangmaensis]|uniref:NfeD family protein n=1 Tax=Sphingomonas qomolangmaensis TaxID=2918765 RepID=A0ABY5LCG2_9SPHN|nr:NfeD family protein [Sphingomonas qomolangmaensis]UUL83505.1 NfeD family protein [Sphingomonas qomolangmaensis]
MDWDNPGLWWIAAGALLAGVELLVPGVFLVFVAIAAAITGAFVLLFPDLPLAGQLASLAAWSAVTIAIGRRWYRDYSPDSADPLLNDVGARMLGATVTVVSSGADGSGRVRVADGEWPSRGPVLPVGAIARVVGVQNTTLIIEPIVLE